MKKILFTPWMLLTGLFVSAQQKDTLMQQTTTDICNCLNKIKVDSSNMKEYKDAFMTCFTTGAMDHIVALAEARHLDITDQKAMESLGVEIGKELITYKCPGYLTYARLTAEEKLDAKKASSESSTRGKLVRIDRKDFVYLVLRDASNREQSFIWLEYFEGSEKYFGSGLEKMIGKTLTISWKEKEFYLPKADNYFKVKEIMGLETSSK